MTWLLIFSDLIVFASSSGKKRIVEDKIALEHIWFEDLGSDKFRIVSPEKMYLVEPSPKKTLDKLHCIQVFERTIIQLLKYRAIPFTDDGHRRSFATDFNGGRFEGEWYFAKPSGRGRMQFQSGNSYVGDFESGRLSGFGKMTYNDNSTFYEGNWQADKPRKFLFKK